MDYVVPEQHCGENIARTPAEPLWMAIGSDARALLKPDCLATLRHWKVV